jgi:hypothetical protein
MWLADGFFTGAGQGTRQVIELMVAFGLTALIGLERETAAKARACAHRRSWASILVRDTGIEPVQLVC